MSALSIAAGSIHGTFTAIVSVSRFMRGIFPINSYTSLIPERVSFPDWAYLFCEAPMIFRSRDLHLKVSAPEQSSPAF